MDIDCDGDQSDPGDGRCGNSGDTQSMTAFEYQVKQYSNQTVSDLNANYIPYVRTDGKADSLVVVCGPRRMMSPQQIRGNC